MKDVLKAMMAMVGGYAAATIAYKVSAKVGAGLPTTLAISGGTGVATYLILRHKV